MNKLNFISGLFTVFAFVNANAQTVSTYAGTQYSGNGGFSGVATSALLSEKYSEVYGICLDTNRRIYVSDQHNVSILTNGNSYTRGGYLGDPSDAGGIGSQNGTGTISRFASPSGLAVRYSDNSVFVCDKDNSTIRRGTSYVNSSQGTIWGTFAGVVSFLGGYKDGSTSSAEFSSPYDIAITANGTIYVSDFGNDCIRKISGSTVTTIAGLGNNTGDADGVGSAARFDAPCGLWLEDDNNLLIADRNNGKIKRLNLTTQAVTTIVNGLSAPTDMVSYNGVLYIADQTCIKTWSSSTAVSILCGSSVTDGYVNGNFTDARFGELDMLTIDPVTSVLYVCDKGNNVVRKVTLNTSAIADFVASKTNPTKDETITLTSTSQFNTSQTWSITPNTYVLHGGSKLTDKVIYVSFDIAQSYSVQLVASNASSNDTELKDNYINVSFNANAAPVADFIASKTDPAKNEEITLIDMSSNSPKFYQWEITPSTGWSVTSGTTLSQINPKITFTANGIYTVKLTCTNDFGSNSKSKVDYITVGSATAKQFQISTLKVYPNPTNGQLFVQNTNNQLVTIIDFKGAVVMSAYSSQLDISTLPVGVYSVQLIDNQVVKTTRIIKN